MCYEVYDRGEGEEGASIIFENGKSDGFAPEEQKEILVPIGISDDLMNYKFENINMLTSIKIRIDFTCGY